MRRAALFSLALHVLLLGGLALWVASPRALPDAADQGVKVELVMLERAGSGTPTAPVPPAPQTPPQPPEPAPPPKPILSPPQPDAEMPLAAGTGTVATTSGRC